MHKLARCQRPGPGGWDLPWGVGFSLCGGLRRAATARRGARARGESTSSGARPLSPAAAQAVTPNVICTGARPGACPSCQPTMQPETYSSTTMPTPCLQLPSWSRGSAREHTGARHSRSTSRGAILHPVAGTFLSRDNAMIQWDVGAPARRVARMILGKFFLPFLASPLSI